MQPLVRIVSSNKGLFVAVRILSGLMLGIGVSQQLQRADTSVAELALAARQIVPQLTRNSAPNSIAVTDESETSTSTAPSGATITSIEPDRGHSRHSYHEGIVRDAPSAVSIRGAMPGEGNQRGDIAQGIGFAIPTGLLARAVPDMIRDGRVVRGWLGVGTTS